MGAEPGWVVRRRMSGGPRRFASWISHRTGRAEFPHPAPQGIRFAACAICVQLSTVGELCVSPVNLVHRSNAPGHPSLHRVPRAGSPASTLLWWPPTSHRPDAAVLFASQRRSGFRRGL